MEIKTALEGKIYDVAKGDFVGADEAANYGKCSKLNKAYIAIVSGEAVWVGTTDDKKLSDADQKCAE